jgi:hypothetical protein
MPKHHYLKLFERYYKAVVRGEKLSEVRYNDRNYRVGDTITLLEGKPGLDGFEYTGRKISARISYIDGFGLNAGYVNLSIKLIDESDVVE